MNRTSRLFLMGSGFVLAAGLGTGLVAYYGGLSTAASARATGLDELKYVPEAAAVVAYANVHDVMNSEFRQKIRQVIPDHDEKGQEEFQRETGINIEQDIDYVVAWMTPTPQADGTGTRPTGLVLARGRFDTAKLEALATSHGATIETIGSVRVIRPPVHEGENQAKIEAERSETPDGAQVRIRRHGHPGGAPMVAFLEPGLIAIGEEATVRAAIEHGGNGRTIRDNQDMANLIGDLEGSANVWAVGRMDALTARADLPEPIRTHLPAVKWFSASSHVGSGISGLLRAEARDEDSAKNLRDVLQGVMAMAKLHAGSKQELAPVMNSLQVTGSGTTVALSFEVPPALVDTLIELKNAN
jgi:hypothetical protein